MQKHNSVMNTNANGNGTFVHGAFKKLSSKTFIHIHVKSRFLTMLDTPGNDP